jgi:flavin reductase (DIM6/NTAB) family NADH-FMN oxidoreductase RutF
MRAFIENQGEIVSQFTSVPLHPKTVLALLPPYPIMLVSTRTNIITINQVAYFTFAPLRMGIAVAHTRHTYGLLKEEQAFVINVPGAELVEAVKFCGAISGRDSDKFAAAGLTPLASLEIDAAGIAECGAQIECRVEQELVFEKRTWFIGPVAAARRQESHRGAEAMMCGREAYSLPGAVIAPR